MDTKMGTKSIVGHSHSPQITKGVYAVGSMSKCPPLNYNKKAPAKWAHHSVLIFNKTLTVKEIVEISESVHPTPRRREAIEHTRRKLGL